MYSWLFSPPILKNNQVVQFLGTYSGSNQLLMVLMRLMANGVYTIYTSSDTLSTLLILLWDLTLVLNLAESSLLPSNAFYASYIFSSLCLLNYKSLQVGRCLQTITDWITHSKMLILKFSQPVYKVFNIFLNAFSCWNQPLNKFESSDFTEVFS